MPGTSGKYPRPAGLAALADRQQGASPRSGTEQIYRPIAQTSSRLAPTGLIKGICGRAFCLHSGLARHWLLTLTGS